MLLHLLLLFAAAAATLLIWSASTDDDEDDDEEADFSFVRLDCPRHISADVPQPLFAFLFLDLPPVDVVVRMAPSDDSQSRTATARISTELSAALA